MIVAIIRYIISAVLSLAMHLIAILLSPFLAAISLIVGPQLPSPLHWFHTADDDLDGGQHQLDWPRNVRGFKLWWQRVRWICRNPAQGFDQYVLGISQVGTQIHWIVHRPKDENGGYANYLCTMRNAKGQRFFSLLWDIKLFRRRYCKFWVGWHWRDEASGYHNLKFNINPFKSKDGG